jgi:hypothetical protein
LGRNNFAGAGLKILLPCLLSSWDYRYEPPHPAWDILSFFFFFFFLSTGIIAQGLMFARQALYHLSYSTNPVFLWGIFKIGYLPRLTSNQDLPDLCLLSS